MYNSKLFQNKYRIDSIRKKGHDYSAAGLYFVTIDTKDMSEYLGEIIDGKMILSELGLIVKKYWTEIPNHFNSRDAIYRICTLDEYIVMPNHVHGIIEILKSVNSDTNRDAINRVYTDKLLGGFAGDFNPMGKKSLGELIRYFKGKSTFEMRKIAANFQWQSNYYDSIIKSVGDLYRVRNYIKNNPLNYKQK